MTRDIRIYQSFCTDDDDRAIIIPRRFLRKHTINICTMTVSAQYFSNNVLINAEREREGGEREKVNPLILAAPPDMTRREDNQFMLYVTLLLKQTERFFQRKFCNVRYIPQQLFKTRNAPKFYKRNILKPCRTIRSWFRSISSYKSLFCYCCTARQGKFYIKLGIILHSCS